MESRERRRSEAPPLGPNIDWLESGTDGTSEFLRQLRSGNEALDRLRFALEADATRWGRGEERRLPASLDV